MQYNRFNQPIGESITDFNNPPMPHFSTLTGIYCRLEKFTEHHIDDLYMHFKEESDAPNWTYLPDDQPQTYIAFKEQFREKITSKDPYYIAVIDKSSNRALGIVSLLRINCNHGTIEVGHIHYSNQLQKSRIATEAQFLLARHVFDNLGYRRYEWKCDALNQPSKKAAQRLLSLIHI